jgi:hypothetical protein
MTRFRLARGLHIPCRGYGNSRKCQQSTEYQRKISRTHPAERAHVETQRIDQHENPECEYRKTTYRVIV